MLATGMSDFGYGRESCPYNLRRVGVEQREEEGGRDVVGKVVPRQTPRELRFSLDMDVARFAIDNST